MEMKNRSELPPGTDITSTPLIPGVEVPIARLKPATWLRVKGIDRSHVKLLAEAFDDLPPILVHESTMRIIDGMHRIEAALLINRISIGVRFFDGGEQDAFLLGIAENSTHGLPLSLADRRSAASRILSVHPDWSDRRVAKCAGLSGKTVAGIRRSEVGSESSESRVGQDGRLRPINGIAGRRRAMEFIETNPDASVGSISQAAGISRSTARNVRHKITHDHEDVLPLGRSRSRPPGISMVDAKKKHANGSDFAEILNRMARDPSLKLTQHGRTMLYWLSSQPAMCDVEDVVSGLALHCLSPVARLARCYASQWADLAECLESRAIREGKVV